VGSMNEDSIIIKGARTHNLKDINLELKMNSITCLCGPSGSGKSSLAFHTLLTESKRRFMNSFPNDVKFFWDIPQSADVDEIRPVLPVWGLAQNNPVIGSRPSAIDLMGINDKLNKLLFYLGENYCSKHNIPLKISLSLSEIINFLENYSNDSYKGYFFLEKADFKESYGDDFLPSRSFDGEVIRDFESDNIFWEIFRFKTNKIGKLEKSFKELNLDKIEGVIKLVIPELSIDKSFRITKKKSCSKCGELEEVRVDSPSVFSPFTPLGACEVCSGHGMNLKYDNNKIVKDDRLSLKEGAVNFLTYSRFSHIQPTMLKEAKKNGIDITKPFKEIDSKKVWHFLNNGSGSYCGLLPLYDYLETKKYKKNVRILIRSLKSEEVCESCFGTRVKNKLLNYAIPGREEIKLKDILNFTFLELFEYISSLEECAGDNLNWTKSKKIVLSLLNVLKVGIDLGLGHVKLLKKVKLLSINEYQKLLLVKYLSFDGSGSLFVLDEASLGLDLEEQKVLLKYLKALKSKKNTVILVDHSEYLQKNSDEIIEMGPGAGHLGGEIVFQGKFKTLKNLKRIKRKKKDLDKMLIKNVKAFDYKKDIELHLEGINIVQGKSSSLKKEFYIESLGNVVSEVLGLEKISSCEVSFSRPKNLPNFEKVLVLNSKFNKFNSRSTVGTMIGLSPYVRKYYASLPVSKNLALKDGHFSTNSELGRCSTCEGRGVVSLDMQFLEDVELLCDDCSGMKLKPFLATISDGNFSIHETLSRPMSEVIPNLKLTPKGKRIWEYLKILNLDYLSLDRSLTSLSGGEKQRMKLLAELQKNVENSLVIFEDLSFGLSSREVHKICEFLESFTEKGNTVVLVDENPIFSNFADKNIQFE
jgi:excinuclease ABC subunit A